MDQHTLRQSAGAKHTSKRIGRGPGSGQGTSAGRGRKGQGKRGGVRPGLRFGEAEAAEQRARGQRSQPRE